ncbi:MAG: metallophosphoesterase [Deferribacteraceae bacterium]|jgi:predicted MPP superfamily phosphohydrolase|nr:metallophosphoesterase [Deferribacteraceae bacterium]
MRFFLFLSVTNIIAFLILGVNFKGMFGHIIRNKYLFWGLIFLFSQSHWMARIVAMYHKVELPWLINYILALLFGIYVFTLLTVIAVDFFIFIVKLIPPLKGFYKAIMGNLYLVGKVVLILTAIQTAVGFFLAWHPFVSEYRLTDPRIANGEKLRIVQISDLHITNYTSRSRLVKVVDKINSLEPDIVVLTGDIIDSKITPYVDKDLVNVFNKLEARYGVYAVLGNHEHYGGDTLQAIFYFSKSGMHVLFDQAVDIDDLGITVVGRQDYRFRRDFSLQPRETLDSILSNNTKGYPVLLFAHRTKDVLESIRHNVFLELSGHTHNGQVFPVNLFLRFGYPKAWGRWTFDLKGYNLIVSCGLGTWGFPFRTSSYSEIVLAEIN